MARFCAGQEEHRQVVEVSGSSILHPAPAEFLQRLLPSILTQVY